MVNTLFHPNKGPNATTGTAGPIFVPRGPSPQAVQPGEYFILQVHSAQAAFRGSIFEHVKELLVTSRVNLHHEALGNQEVFALQQSRDVQKDRAEQLGLAKNLISLVPATMPNVSVSIEFIVDKENRLAALGGLINDSSFLSVISLAPGVAAAAKTIGDLAQKVIQTFVPAEERQPILTFDADFNIGTGAGDQLLTDGYYVILGTASERDPIPSPLPALVVQPASVQAGGRDLTELSYVVLEVTRLPVRTREASAGALWDKKLRDAESRAQEVADNPFITDDQKRDVWTQCTALLTEGRTLLQADANYAPGEAASIYKTVYKHCTDLMTGKEERAISKGLAFVPDNQAVRTQLGISTTEDLDAVASDYAHQSDVARQIMAQVQ